MPKPGRTDPPASVATVFDSYPEKVKERLLELRDLVLKTAAEDEEVGPLEEALRWGEPSYLTTASGTGTTIRISTVRGTDEKYAMYVNCQTTLVETYRQMYPDLFEYSGTRAVIFDVDAPIQAAPLQHMISLALRYNRDRKANVRKA